MRRSTSSPSGFAVNAEPAQEGRFERLNGQDATAFIVSVNLARRKLTKSQRAMALAMVYPEPEKGGRGKNVESRKAADSAGFGSTRLEQARAVSDRERLRERPAAVENFFDPYPRPSRARAIGKWAPEWHFGQND
jgi:hypothetical protein